MKFPPCVSPKTGRWLALAAALLLAGGAVLFNSMSAPEAPPPLAIPPSRPERFVAPPPPPAEHLLVLRGEALAAQAGTAPGPAPAVPELHENFDRAQPGALPGGWSRWSSDSAATVGASPNRAASAPNGLAFSGNTQAVVRAFPTATVPADVQVSALVYLDTLMPAQLLVRGSGLNTAAPSYYAAAVTRGLEVQLLALAFQPRVVFLAACLLLAAPLDLTAQALHFRLRVIARTRGRALRTQQLWQDS